MPNALSIHRRVCPDAKIRASEKDEEGNGWLEGYLAVFGNVDHGYERIKKGAFKKSGKERVKAGKVPLMIRHFAHGGDVADVVGMVVDAKEDDYGLLIRGEFLDDELSQATRAKVSVGAAWGLSVGYELMAFTEKKEDGKFILELTECKLLEGTITCRPMNELAVITAAKSLRDDITAGRFSSETGPLDSIDQLVEALERLMEPFKSKTDIPKAHVPLPVTDDSWRADIAKAKQNLARQTLALAGLKM